MLFLPILSRGQITDESYAYLPDTLKKEVKSFHFLEAKERDTSNNFVLKKIPLVRCSDSFAYFDNSNFISIKNEIGIYSRMQNTGYKIYKVKFIHCNYIAFVPDSAFNDVYDPVFCEKCTKKYKPVLSNVRVFSSNDGNRIYIDLLKTKGSKKYEITWIFQDSKYLRRTVDYL